MTDVVKFSSVESKVLLLRKQQVILDCDVAELYEVETKRINEAVKNNPDKFPAGYVFELTENEYDYLRSKISTANFNKNRFLPKAFTEKGLYMLATVLKSKRATETTIEIVETFAKLRELSRTVIALSETPEVLKQKSLLQRSSQLISDVFGEELEINGTETSIELNLAVLKLKHTVKRK
jgi:hypothetical protein